MKKEFVEALLNLLKEQELSQKELAKSLNVEESVVSRWLNGKTKPTNKSLGKLAKFFNVPVGYFLDKQSSSENENGKESNINLKLIMNLIEKQTKLMEENNKRYDIEIEYLKDKIKLLEERLNK